MYRNYYFLGIIVRLIKKNIILSFILISALFYKTSFANTGWQILESYFKGKGSAQIWNARIASVDENSPEFQVTKCYGSASIIHGKEYEYDEKLADHTFSIAGEQAVLTLWKREMISVEAILDPPIRILYTFVLMSGERLLIKQEHLAVVRQDYFSIDEIPVSDKGHLLKDEPKMLSEALQKSDESIIKQSSIVQLANWLLSARVPLGPAEERIIPGSCKALINNRESDIPVIKRDDERIVLKINANKEDSVTLFPRFYVKSLIPFCDHVDINEEMLPAYAFVKLECEDGAVRTFGKPASGNGEFQFGPVKAHNLRKMKLSALYPLEPPGTEPSITIEILYRSGRPVEAYLDRGKLPPPPPIPAKLKKKKIITTTLSHVALAINPDIGIVEGLDHENLLDLYAVAFKEAKQHPDLLEILNEAAKMELGEKSWSFPHYKEKLSPDSCWTKYEAMAALKDTSLSGQLAKKIITGFEPMHELVMTKVPSDNTREKDKKTAFPHAIAAAALIRADAGKYDELIKKQVEHLVDNHNLLEPCELSLDEIIKAGQALKLCSNFTSNKRTKKLSAKMVKALRNEAYNRFVQTGHKLLLKEKVRIAHLISPVWRPYFKTPEFLLAKEKSNHEEIMPVQRMAPGPYGRDITGEVLEDARLRYKAAFGRSLDMMKKSDMPLEEKQGWINSFHDKWYDYLFGVHKGGYLQPYEGDLNRDRERAMKVIEED
ncbi:MAG: hypothetical protein ABII90_12380 [Bacteroidota bacterium]